MAGPGRSFPFLHTKKPSSGWYTVIWKSAGSPLVSCMWSSMALSNSRGPRSRAVQGLLLTKGHLRRADLGHLCFLLASPWHPGVLSSYISPCADLFQLTPSPWITLAQTSLASWFIERNINIKCILINGKGRCHLTVYQQQLNDILMSLWKWQFMSPYLSMDIYIPRPVLLMTFSSSIYSQTESQVLLIIFLRQWSRFSFEIIFPHWNWLCKPMSKYKGDSQLK